MPQAEGFAIQSAEETSVPAIPAIDGHNRAQNLSQRGKAARARAAKRATRAGKSRPGDAEWFPEVEYLQTIDPSYTQKEIASALGFKDARRIRQIVASTRGLDGATVTVPAGAVQGDALDPKYQAMLPFTAEAFELFFNEFSPFNLAPHCKTWIKDFIENPNLMINIPPRHAKSIIFSVWLPIWLIVRNRDEQIILVSKTNTLAQGFCQTIAQMLELSEIPKVFGKFKPPSGPGSIWRPSQGQILVEGATPGERGLQLSIQARGSGQAILGMEATVVIVDDATEAATARSDVLRENELSWLQQNVLSRIMPAEDGTASGRGVVVGQRVHPRDLYGELAMQTFDMDLKDGRSKGDPIWHLIKYPAVIAWPEENGGEAIVLWPELRDYEYLMGQRARVGGTYAFETLFQQNPRADGQIVYNPDWWESCKDKGRDIGESVRVEGGRDFLPMTRVVSIDPSPSQWGAMTVADVWFPDQLFACSIIEHRRWKAGGQPVLMREMQGAIRAYKPDYLILEHSGFSTYLKDDPIYRSIQDQTHLLPHHTGNNKHHESFGVESLSGDIESGRIRWPAVTPACIDMMNLFRDEIEAYPAGRTSDVLMTVWFIKWNSPLLFPPNAYSDYFDGKQPSSWSSIRKDDRDSKRPRHQATR